MLARAPELCLIDELAHTNAPGVEHPKRYEDIADVLAAGIDVFSTVNVQHLESLNDQVAELTGVRVRETVPDDELERADEIVLVDLPPEDLIARLQAGKVYPAARVPNALDGFFRVENLRALREVALRQVAETVEVRRVEEQPIAERLLAFVGLDERDERVVRRAWRSAQRLAGELDVLVVADSQPSAEQRRRLEELRRMTAMLGAHLLVEEGDALEVLRRVARERGTTYILLGPPKPSRLREPLLLKILRALPGHRRPGRRSAVDRGGVGVQRAWAGDVAHELHVLVLEGAPGARGREVGAEQQRGGVDVGDRAQRRGDVGVRDAAEPGGLHVGARRGPDPLDRVEVAHPEVVDHQPRELGQPRRQLRQVVAVEVDLEVPAAQLGEALGEVELGEIAAAEQVHPVGADAAGVERQRPRGRRCRPGRWRRRRSPRRAARARRAGRSGRRPGRSRRRPRRP